MENGQLREQLQAAEQASAARRASPLPPTPITAGKGGATAAPDKAQLGELIPAYRSSQAIGAHMQQSTTQHVQLWGEPAERMMHGTSVATLSTETPMTEHAQGSGDTMTSSVEDALLHDAILEWGRAVPQHLCMQPMSKCGGNLLEGNLADTENACKQPQHVCGSYTYNHGRSCHSHGMCIFRVHKAFFRLVTCMLDLRIVPRCCTAHQSA